MIALFPEILTCSVSGDTEKLAILIRRYFGGGNASKPCLNMDELLAIFGMPIVYRSGLELGAIAMDDTKGKLRLGIFLKAGLALIDESFIKAHLLGHFLLHLQHYVAEGEQPVTGFRENINPLERFNSGVYHSSDEQLIYKERQADFFAAALLMPMGMFKRAFDVVGNLDKIANIFGVSRKLVVGRLQSLNLLDRRSLANQNFLIAEQALQKQKPSLDHSDHTDILSSPIVPNLDNQSTHSSTLNKRQAAKAYDEQKVAETPVSSPQKKISPLDRIRALAQKIDHTVRID